MTLQVGRVMYKQMQRLWPFYLTHLCHDSEFEGRPKFVEALEKSFFFRNSSSQKLGNQISNLTRPKFPYWPQNNH